MINTAIASACMYRSTLERPELPSRLPMGNPNPIYVFWAQSESASLFRNKEGWEAR